MEKQDKQQQQVVYKYVEQTVVNDNGSAHPTMLGNVVIIQEGVWRLEGVRKAIQGRRVSVW